MPNRFIVQINFNDGTGWIDISQYTRIREFKRERHVYNRLKTTIDSCSFKVQYNPVLLNRLLFSDEDIELKIFKNEFWTDEDRDDESLTEDDVKQFDFESVDFEDENIFPYFTGYVKKEYKMKSSSRVDWVEITAIDYNYILDSVILAPIVHSDIALFDGLNPSDSLVHIILNQAGISNDYISDDVLAWDGRPITIEFFKHLKQAPEGDNPALSEIPYGGTYQEIITNLLFQYGYTYYFDEDGVFQVFDFKTTSLVNADQIGPYIPEINNSNMEGALTFQKKVPRYEQARITWQKIIQAKNEYVFDETTGADDDYPFCRIEVPPDGYYPEGADASNMREAFYSFDIDGRTEDDLLGVYGTTKIDEYESTYQEKVDEECVEWKNGASEPQLVKTPIMGWKKVGDKKKCKGFFRSLGTVIKKWITDTKYIEEKAIKMCCRKEGWLGVCVKGGVQWRIKTYAYTIVGYDEEWVDPECLEYRDIYETKTESGGSAVKVDYEPGILSFKLRVHNKDTSPVTIKRLQVKADKIYLKGEIQETVDATSGDTDKVFRYKAPYIHNKDAALRLANAVHDYYYYSTFTYKLRSSEEFEPGTWVLLSDKNFFSIDGQPLENKLCLIKTRKDLEFEEIHDYELEEYNMPSDIRKEIEYLYSGGKVVAYNSATVALELILSASGGVSVSGTAEYVKSKENWVYSPPGPAPLAVSGRANTVEDGYKYTTTGSGKIKVSGSADEEIFTFYIYTGNASVLSSGSAASEYSRFYSYTPSGTLSVYGDAYTAETLFISVWKTDNITYGSSDDHTINLPLQYHWTDYNGNTTIGTYDFTVDWGDGTIERYTSVLDTEPSHTYEAPGEYEVVITGDMKGWAFRDNYDFLKLLEIKEFGGGFGFADVGMQFYRCENLVITADDFPSLTGMTDLSRMFFNVGSFNEDVSQWDVSNVKDMAWMFYNCGIFTGTGVEHWDVSSATTMAGMFYRCLTFTGDVSTWNVSSVRQMGYMFTEAGSFNSDISGWNVSSVFSMQGMFDGAEAFSADISSWNVSNVTTMSSMFADTLAFNSDISAWDVSSVKDMSYMFSRSAFNTDLTGWDVSNVENMAWMFYNSDFNSDPAAFLDISSLDTTKIYGMLVHSFTNSALSPTNYSSLLQHLATFDVPEVILGARNITYTAAGTDAKNKLEGILGWNITDGGPE